MLNLVIEPYYALPCALTKFTINGITAAASDFGMNQDVHPEWRTTQYGCGDKQFIPHDKLDFNTLKLTYNITEAEAIEVQNKLKDVLHVGKCNWCE